ncbi:MAG: DinB family protein [Chloroflexi bacterium]|nr:DinB family protein [Chloroflexota bacterium]
MHIDFAPVENGEIQFLAFSRQFSVADLRASTNTSVDTLREIVAQVDDAQVAFLPHDAEAHDPYAVEGEEEIGWSLGHLIAHVTASSEEWAAYSSILARGIVYPADPRLRYETPWREVTTKAHALQRLDESRRIRLGYLDTWPDTPNLEVLRELSPRFVAKVGELNATACFLFGLRHEVGHYDQIREAVRQAREATTA